MAPFTASTIGAVSANLGDLAPCEPFRDETKRRELLARLNRIDGVALPPEKLKAYPTFPLAALATDPALRQFLEVLDWAVAQFGGVDGER